MIVDFEHIQFTALEAESAIKPLPSKCNRMNWSEFRQVAKMAYFYDDLMLPGSCRE